MHNNSNNYIMHAMPTSITIRNVPDRTRDELAARAARSGRSLQEYLRRELIVLADKPDIEYWLAQVERRVQVSQTKLSSEEILSYIHDGRR